MRKEEQLSQSLSILLQIKREDADNTEYDKEYTKAKIIVSQSEETNDLLFGSAIPLRDLLAKLYDIISKKDAEDSKFWENKLVIGNNIHEYMDIIDRIINKTISGE